MAKTGAVIPLILRYAATFMPMVLFLEFERNRRDQQHRNLGHLKVDVTKPGQVSAMGLIVVGFNVSCLI